MGVRRRGGKTGICTSLEIETKKQKFPENSSLLPISWVNSCNDRLFADMTFILHESQFTVLV